MLFIDCKHGHKHFSGCQGKVERIKSYMVTVETRLRHVSIIFAKLNTKNDEGDNRDIKKS